MEFSEKHKTICSELGLAVVKKRNDFGRLYVKSNPLPYIKVSDVAGKELSRHDKAQGGVEGFTTF